MKLKPVLLESKDKLKPNDIVLNNTSDNLFIISRKTINAWTNIPQIGDDIDHLKPQHIYLIDETAEIKECDLVINKKLQVFRCNKSYSDILFNPTTKEPIKKWNGNKIIASTQQLEGIPQLSKQSIKLLIDYYNNNGKMPEFVKVEETFKKQVTFGNCIYKEINDDGSYYELINGEVEKTIHLKELESYGVDMFEIKLNSQNQVEITIPEERVYNREEVEELLHQIVNDSHCKPNRIKQANSNECAKFTISWINKNL